MAKSPPPLQAGNGPPSVCANDPCGRSLACHPSGGRTFICLCSDMTEVAPHQPCPEVAPDYSGLEGFVPGVSQTTTSKSQHSLQNIPTSAPDVDLGTTPSSEERPRSKSFSRKKNQISKARRKKARKSDSSMHQNSSSSNLCFNDPCGKGKACHPEEEGFICICRDTTIVEVGQPCPDEGPVDAISNIPHFDGKVNPTTEESLLPFQNIPTSAPDVDLRTTPFSEEEPRSRSFSRKKNQTSKARRKKVRKSGSSTHQNSSSSNLCFNDPCGKGKACHPEGEGSFICICVDTTIVEAGQSCPEVQELHSGVPVLGRGNSEPGVKSLPLQYFVIGAAMSTGIFIFLILGFICWRRRRRRAAKRKKRRKGPEYKEGQIDPPGVTLETGPDTKCGPETPNDPYSGQAPSAREGNCQGPLRAPRESQKGVERGISGDTTSYLAEEKKKNVEEKKREEVEKNVEEREEEKVEKIEEKREVEVEKKRGEREVEEVEKNVEEKKREEVENKRGEREVEEVEKKGGEKEVEDVEKKRGEREVEEVEKNVEEKKREEVETNVEEREEEEVEKETNVEEREEREEVEKMEEKEVKG